MPAGGRAADNHIVRVAWEPEKNTMSRSLTSVWLLLVLAIAGEVWALGLGDIRLSSALNEPLRAEIELLSATPEEVNNLAVTLASEETFARYGLDRPLFLQKINFTVMRSRGVDGSYITVNSLDPVTEPFVTFLVEVIWSRGRLLREYTVLLDPPTFAPPPVQESTSAVTAPRRVPQADSGRIERRAEPRTAQPRPSQPVTGPAPTRSEPLDPSSFDTTGGGDYYVQRGDTLWRIALNMRPDSRLTMNQTMLAIFEANPQAFAGNINIMSAGVSLRIPNADEIFRISRGEALTEVQRQISEWGGVMPVTPAPQPTLVLVPPDDDQTDYRSGFDTAGVDDVDEDRTEIRIQDIRDTLDAHQNSLIEIEDNELAALRQELARLSGEEYVEPAALDDDLDAQLGDDETIDTGFDPELADDAAVTDVVDDDAGSVTEPPVVRTQPRGEAGIVERVIKFFTEGIWGYLIGAMFIVLGILVWFARRGASSDDEDSTGVWDALDADDLDGESLASTERLRALAQEDDSAIVVVEQESAPIREAEEDVSIAATIEVPATTEDAAASTIDFPEPVEEIFEVSDDLEPTGENVAIEDTFSSETAINLDQSDPVAEADFHMAYGLYDQAADLINGALAVEPEREDLLAKLCEIYFVWGNQDSFVDAASRLHSIVGGSSTAEWDKIVIMGQQIAADNEMFSGAGPAPAREVDLSFEGALDDEGDLDIDLAEGTGAADIIDLGEQPAISEPAEDEIRTEEMPTMESDLSDTTGEILAVDEPAEISVSDYTGITAQMPALDDTRLTEEMPTPEMPLAATDSTGESMTMEEQFRVLEETGELPAIGDDEATRLASLDDPDDEPSIGGEEATEMASLGDDDEIKFDATAEIDLDDLGLDLHGLAETGLASDLEDTATEEALPNEDTLTVTGTVEGIVQFDEMSSAGGIPALDTEAATGMHEALDPDATDAVTGMHEALDPDAADAVTGIHEALDSEGTDVGVEIDTSLLDATGQTQILSGDMAIGTASEIESAITDEDNALLVPDEDEDTIVDEAETQVAPLDDNDDGDSDATVMASSDEDFDFAKTEALPKDVFTGIDRVDDTGELPSIAHTDVDLDLDDLTAALRVSGVGDTIDQPRDDATVEYPSPSFDEMGGEDDLSPTTRLGPEDLSDDLHDARTMTEVGTKLDLARAYVDMGDPGGARSILEEVLSEGDDSQKQQAQQLIDSLPG